MGLTTIDEFDYNARLVQSRHTIRKVEHREYKVDMARWVAKKISKFSTDAP